MRYATAYDRTDVAFDLDALRNEIDSHLNRAKIKVSSIIHQQALPEDVIEQLAREYRKRGWEVSWNVSPPRRFTSLTFIAPSLINRE